MTSNSTIVESLWYKSDIYCALGCYGHISPLVKLVWGRRKIKMTHKQKVHVKMRCNQG